jgi:hypothetical protein
MKNGSNVVIVRILFLRFIKGYLIGLTCIAPGVAVGCVKGIKPPTLSARENYKPWKDEELVYIHQVLNKEIMPYQCAIKLDRSLASIESKCRRVKRRMFKTFSVKDIRGRKQKLERRKCTIKR